ncbi:MAG: DUF616 domain-containing protein [Paludibacteraceae bacterium]|nr:DUF616 domain-containing protein [Paludibacteraceae bacterium]
MKNYVIYTVLVGDCDELQQPLVTDERFDYIVFSDRHIDEQIGVWHVRAFDYMTADRTMLSRYPKVLAHRVLGEYVASLYMDANITIISAAIYDRVVELANRQTVWAGINHSYHDCLYKELDWVVAHRLEYAEVCARWQVRLINEHFPKHAGLFENGIIFRTHTPLTAQLNEQWWSLMQQVSHRDQLTLRYVLWRNGVELTYLLPPTHTPRHSTCFAYRQHLKDDKGKYINYENKVFNC